MTQPAPPLPPQPFAPAPRRRTDVLGIVSFIVAAIALLPTLFVFLIGLIPSWNAIWWLGLVLIPICAFAGAIAIILGVIGVIVAARARARFVWSAIGIALGALLLVPGAWVYIGSLQPY